VAARFPRSSILAQVTGVIPVTNVLPKMVTDGYLCVGDAAHQSDPLTAGGIGPGMIGGQLLDITFSAENATEASLGELMLKKTGALITASVRAGALLGGASAAALKAVTVFGENIGLAFQVRDDIHDSAERPKKGAPAGPNYARAFGAERARNRLRFFVGNGLAALDKGKVKAPLLRRLSAQLLP
jgi:geranylgeranyl diphosphate synthase type II